MLYCEGTTDRTVQRWLKRHALEPAPAKVAAGTLLPTPDYYHVPLQPDLMHELAAIVDAEAIALPCLHVHVYREQRVLLEWHDAFLDNPVLLSRSLPVERERPLRVLRERTNWSARVSGRGDRYKLVQEHR